MKKYFVVKAEQVIEFEYLVVADNLKEAKHIANSVTIDFDSPNSENIETTGDISAWGKPLITSVEEMIQ